MEDLRVSTERLELAPLTLDEIEALIAGDGARLRELTGVLFPRPAGPPPYMADPLPTVRERLRARPDEARWWNWLIFERETKRAVGSVSFGGPPDESGAVLIGYAMYEQFEGHGYAQGGGERRDAAGGRRRGRRRRRGAGLRPQRSSIRRIGLIISARTTAAASAMAVTMPKRVGSGMVS
jgi:hypothetical protein